MQVAKQPGLARCLHAAVVGWGCDAEILCKIDDAHMLRNGMLLEERLTLAVSEAEENDIDFVERHVRRKGHVSLSNQPFMHIAHGVPGIALAIGEHNLRIGMVEQQADEFTSGVACSSQYSYFYHNFKTY